MSVAGKDTVGSSNGIKFFTNSFTTYKFPNVDSDTHGSYSTSGTTEGVVTIPYDGLYAIQGTMRTKDNSPADTQFGVGVHTSNADFSHFLWTTTNNNANGPNRTTYPYSRTVRLSANDEVRMFLFVDNGSTGLEMSGGALTIYKLSD